MNDKLQIFNSNEFGEVRTMMIDNEPYFVASDLCKALGYANPRKAVSDHCDTEDVTKRDTLTKGGLQSMSYVNESGMYSLIFGSKLPQAKAFKRWVTAEVLPAIRQHGAYATPQTIDQMLDDPDAFIVVIKRLKQEREEKEHYKAQMELQAEVVREVAPKAQFFDQVMQSESIYLTDQIAKELGMTAIRLNRQLEGMGIQFRRGAQWVLYAKYANKGYTRTKTYIYTKRDGAMESVVRTVWTEPGRHFLHQLLGGVTHSPKP